MSNNKDWNGNGNSIFKTLGASNHTDKERGDFFYYENAPEPVRLMVNRIDMSALADLYKVTKDRRI